MMTMKSRNQYLETLIRNNGGYHTQSKKKRSALLDEYCKNTGQNRKYIIRKIRAGKWVKDPTKTKERKRKEYYDGDVKVNLIKIWKIFDYPCGERLVTILRDETERLRKFGEIQCSGELTLKLKEISAKTIDRKLKREKELLYLRRKYQIKKNPLLYQKIPIKLSNEQNRQQLGNMQIDLVEHCGQNPKGEYLNTLSLTDISSGWWEGRAIKGKSEKVTAAALDNARDTSPFRWQEIHSDNGTEFINDHLFRYSKQTNLGFSRSRPEHKNDNCLVEQKNFTHVRRYVGYRRYDKAEEQNILNDLYQNELRFYKNFFQPQIKLKQKIRVGSRLQRKYYPPLTPYWRLMKSKSISQDKKQELVKIYRSLNPAQLKRTIDHKLKLLYEINQHRQNKNSVYEVERNIKNHKKLKPTTVTFLMSQPEAILVT